MEGQCCETSYCLFFRRRLSSWSSSTLAPWQGAAQPVDDQLPVHHHFLSTSARLHHCHHLHHHQKIQRNNMTRLRLTARTFVAGISIGISKPWSIPPPLCCERTPVVHLPWLDQRPNTSSMLRFSMCSIWSLTHSWKQIKLFLFFCNCLQTPHIFFLIKTSNHAICQSAKSCNMKPALFGVIKFWCFVSHAEIAVRSSLCQKAASQLFAVNKVGDYTKQKTFGDQFPKNDSENKLFLFP